jgi:hypothetical protein
MKRSGFARHYLSLTKRKKAHMRWRDARLLLATLAWGSAATAAHATCDFGPDTCLPGFVWREAFPGDHVCVTGATRTEAASDNALASQRRSPTGGPFGPDTCLPGFVWREASPADHVCVTGATRTQAASDNAQAAARRDPQCAAGPSDASPPVLIETTLTFQRVVPPPIQDVGSTPVPPAGLTVSPVARDRRFVITASAGDNESGIASITAAMDTTSVCTSTLTGVASQQQPGLDGRSDEEKNGTAAAGNPLLRSAHFTVDPFESNPFRLDCPAIDDASGLRARATLTVRNGKGLATSSGPIVVIYAPRPHTGLASGAICGDARGQTQVCTTGTTCEFKRDKVCDGWWIFSHCDYVQSTDMFCL